MLISGSFSNWEEVTPRLSLVLFTIFINEGVQGIFIKFADDTR